MEGKEQYASVRVRADLKKRLDDLQDDVRRSSGVKPTLSELLDRALNLLANSVADSTATSDETEYFVGHSSGSVPVSRLSQGENRSALDVRRVEAPPSSSEGIAHHHSAGNTEVTLTQDEAEAISDFLEVYRGPEVLREAIRQNVRAFRVVQRMFRAYESSRVAAGEVETDRFDQLLDSFSRQVEEIARESGIVLRSDTRGGEVGRKRAS